MRYIWVAALVGVVAGGGMMQGQVASRPDQAAVPAEFRFLFRQFMRTNLETQPDPWAALPYDSITLQAGSCMIECAPYKLTFHRGGTSVTGAPDDGYGLAELDAVVPEYVRARHQTERLFPLATGRFDGRVDVWTYGRLSYLLKKANFDTLPASYSTGWTDEQTVTLSVTANGRTKSISDEGDAGPIELWAIRAIMNAAGRATVWRER